MCANISTRGLRTGGGTLKAKGNYRQNHRGIYRRDFEEPGWRFASPIHYAMALKPRPCCPNQLATYVRCARFPNLFVNSDSPVRMVCKMAAKRDVSRHMANYPAPGRRSRRATQQQPLTNHNAHANAVPMAPATPANEKSHRGRNPANRKHPPPNAAARPAAPMPAAGWSNEEMDKRPCSHNATDRMAGPASQAIAQQCR